MCHLSTLTRGLDFVILGARGVSTGVVASIRCNDVYYEGGFGPGIRSEGNIIPQMQGTVFAKCVPPERGGGGDEGSGILLADR